MITRKAVIATVLGVLSLAGGPAAAAVSAEQAARLGKDLTPMGAKRAGNEAGTIPEWTGGLPVKPIDPEVGHVNPYPEEEPKFWITRESYDKYRDRLSAGLIALLEKYGDTYRIPVYPTHRSHANPQFVYDAIRANATRATLKGTDQISGAARAPAFPIPSNAREVVWNHKLKYVAEGASYYLGTAVVNQDGSYMLVRAKQELLLKYNSTDDPARVERSNLFVYFLQQTLSPARLAGGVLLVHQYLDQTEDQNMAWLYNPGQRRVRRAPEFGYDHPSQNSDALATVDQFNMFNGPLDRYRWELVGKREMYIPYNAYDLVSKRLEPDDIVGEKHIDPDLTRYELHRVWVVDARLREGTRHIYKRRTFYVDEDSWHIALADHYDNRDQLWRVQIGHLYTLYDIPATLAGVTPIYDLAAGRYIVSGLTNNEPAPDYHWESADAYFRPSNLRRLGTR